MSAWEDACNFKESSIFLIPEGTFFLNEVSFSGPCFNDLSPKVLILGTLVAPTNLTADVWIRFDSLRHLTLTGGNGSAILDGQGAETWSSGSDCRHRLTCDMFTTVSIGRSKARNSTYNFTLCFFREKTMLRMRDFTL